MDDNIDQELLKFAISQVLFAAIFVWLLIDMLERNLKLEKNILLNYNSKLGCCKMEDLYEKQAEIIKLLTDIISINLKQEYIKSIKKPKILLL